MTLVLCLAWGSVVPPSLEAGSVDLVFGEFPGSLGAAVSKGKISGHVSVPAEDFTHEAVIILTLFRYWRVTHKLAMYAWGIAGFKKLLKLCLNWYVL